MASVNPRVPVKFDKVQKYFGAVKVLEEFDLDIQPGEFLVLLGASGSGKTTALRILSGLETATGGPRADRRQGCDQHPPQVPRHLHGVPVLRALIPTRRAENIGFPLKVRKVPKPEADAQVRDAAAQVQLDGLLDRYPRELSAASASAWRWREPSSAGHRSFSWTNHCPTSMPSSGATCGLSSNICNSRSASLPFTSPTTRSKP